MYASNTYILASLTDSEFERRVDRASVRGTVRRMDLALLRAEQILSQSRGRKIVILLTAGKQGAGGKTLEEAIKPLREIGAHTYVVGIGRGTDGQEISKIVQRPQDKFKIDSIENLPLHVRQIAKKIHEKPGMLLQDVFLASIFQKQLRNDLLFMIY